MTTLGDRTVFQTEARIELESQLQRFQRDTLAETVGVRVNSLDFAAADPDRSWDCFVRQTGSQSPYLKRWGTRDPDLNDFQDIDVLASSDSHLRAADTLISIELLMVRGKRFKDRGDDWSSEIEQLKRSTQALICVLISDFPADWLSAARRTDTPLVTLIAARHLTHASAAIVWFRKRTNSGCDFVAFERSGTKDKRRRRAPLRVAVGQGIVGTAVDDESVRMISGTSLLERAHNPEYVKQNGWTCALAIPLHFGGSVPGAMSLYCADEPIIADALKVLHESAVLANATMHATSRSNRAKRKLETESLRSGATKVQAGLTMLGLVHDLANHAGRVESWARHLRPSLEAASARAGIASTVNDMIRSAELVGRLTKTMDAVALERNTRVERVDVAERLADLDALLRDIDPRISTAISCKALVRGPGSFVERLVFNLVFNSMYWTPKDGKIEVRLEPGPTSSPTLVVVDAGSGMTESVLNQARVPFFSTRSNGSGLGLYVVEEICATIGARFSISSKQHLGTTVRIEFVQHETNAV